LAPGEEFPLAGPTVVGRQPDCDLMIDEPYVSGEHAELSNSGGRWFVRDLASTNGTFLNGHRVEGYADIHPGDVVQFGRVQLEFVT
jgi:pSer/pThr/pTyr-binding forkhead associated (FHA) protein